MVVEWGSARARGWRKDRYRPLKLLFWTGCAVAILWSASVVAGTQPAGGPPQAIAAQNVEAVASR